jgi:uncharacterized protein
MKLNKLVLLFALILITSASVAQTIVQPKIKKIVVMGSAEMEVDPDEIYVNFVLREYQDKQKNKIGIEKIKKDFLAACEKAGVLKENIRVEGMSGSAYNDWFVRKRRREPEFVASVTYIIKFTGTKMIDNLVPNLSDEAVSNMYISKSTHSKMEEYRKEIKIKSTQAARDKAKYLSESIGEKMGNALLIEEIDNSGPYPMMMKQSNMSMEMAQDGAYGGETSMPFEKIKIRYETRAEFELL